MCGIAGYVCLGDKRPSLSEVMSVWQNLTARGTHAAGAAMRSGDGEITVLKNAGLPSSLRPEMDSLTQSGMPDTMIMHTRHATKGPVSNNKNNHPLFDEKAGLVLVHNGMLSNDDKYLEGKRRDGQVDSEAFVRVMSDHGSNWREKVEAVGKEMDGSWAIAAMSRNLRGIVLFRHNNPIDWILDEHNEIFWFSSDDNYVKRAMNGREWHGFTIQAELRCASLANDTAIVVDKHGLREYWSYDVPVKPKAITSYPSYHSRGMWQDEDDYSDLVECKTCKTTITKLGGETNKMICYKCNGPLTPIIFEYPYGY